MYKNKKILAIIPARAGSRRLAGKNIWLLAGKPLIAWSIEQALSSKYIDKVIVSTESAAIAAIARRYGAEVPFLRPKNLATDKAKSADVILHTMKWMEKECQAFDIVMLLQPTSPLRSCSDIDASIKWLFARNAYGVVSVCQSEHNPLWCNTLLENYSMEDFIKSGRTNKLKQKASSFYRLNGALYLSDWHYFKKQKNFFNAKTVAFIMPQERSVDIDTRLDFDFAEFLKLKYSK